MIGGFVHGDRTTLIRGGYLLTLDPAIGDLPNADVLIEGDKIAAVGVGLTAGPHANVIDARVARRVDLDHVEIFPLRDQLARIALPTRRLRRLVARKAIERLREDAGHRSLAHPARAAEQVAMMHPPDADRVPQRLHDRPLPDDLVKRLAAILSCENGVRHRVSLPPFARGD